MPVFHSNRPCSWLVITTLAMLATAPIDAREFTLEAAMEKVAKVHPQLRVFESRLRLLEAEADTAMLPPGFRVDADIENFAGEGAYAGTSQAEYTLTLAGVLERGMKREARRAVAAGRIDALGVERAVAELDLLAEVNRRYLDWVEASLAPSLTARARDDHQSLVQVMHRVHRHGGVSQAVVLAAEAENARLLLEHEQSVRDSQLAWQRLALLWGDAGTSDPAPAFTSLPQNLPDLVSLPDMLDKIRRLPDIEYFASVQRIQESELHLIELERRRDVEWRLGLRRLQGDSATAIVAGLSIPLGQSSRLALRTAAERARQESLFFEKNTRLQSLETVLIRMYGEAERERHRLLMLDEQVLPRLRNATEQGVQALQSGALSYMELGQMRRELWVAEKDRLTAQVNFYRSLVELQRLTTELWSSSNKSNGAQQ
jgi:outer membrane protein, heavy metal efflux system